MIQRWVVDKWQCVAIPWRFSANSFYVYIFEVLGSMVAQMEVAGPYNLNEWPSMASAVNEAARIYLHGVYGRIDGYHILFDETRCGPKIHTYQLYALATDAILRLRGEEVPF